VKKAEEIRNDRIGVAESIPVNLRLESSGISNDVGDCHQGHLHSGLQSVATEMAKHVHMPKRSCRAPSDGELLRGCSNLSRRRLSSESRVNAFS
jgi:hypothetical protein